MAAKNDSNPGRPLPAQIGAYRVEGELGEGTMAVVYAARDKAERPLALKVLKWEGIDPAVFRRRQARLAREGEALRLIRHENVVSVYEFGAEGNSVYIAMERIDGINIRDWLDQEPRPAHQILGIFLRAARGLAAAHAMGIMHRDFKPANVLLSNSGRVVVSDFGLARLEEDRELPGSALGLPLTRTGVLLGTPRYMAPEQHQSLPADARVDQFSFCVALYEALYRELPFRVVAREGLSPDTAYALEVCAGRICEPSAEYDVPPTVKAVVFRGLDKDPEKRFPSMRELIAALDPLVTKPKKRIHPAVATMAGGLVGAVVAMAVFAIRPDKMPVEALCPKLKGQVLTASLKAASSRWGNATASRLADRAELRFTTLRASSQESCIQSPKNAAAIEACFVSEANAFERLVLALLGENASLAEVVLADLELGCPPGAHGKKGAVDASAAVWIERLESDFADLEAKPRLASAAAALAVGHAEKADRALEVLLASDPKPDQRAQILAYRSSARASLGQLDQAKQSATEGIAFLEAQRPVEALRLSDLLHQRGWLLAGQSEWEASAKDQRRCLELRIAELGVEDLRTVDAQFALAYLDFASGSFGPAIEKLEAVLFRRDKEGAGIVARAEARFLLAQALNAARLSPGRVRQLAESARELLATLKSAKTRDVLAASVAAFLQRPPDP